MKEGNWNCPAYGIPLSILLTYLKKQMDEHFQWTLTYLQLQSFFNSRKADISVMVPCK
jgi:hypothetical protein